MRRHLAALLAVLLPLPACGSSKAAAAPALTRKEAMRILAHYESVNNRANAGLDGDLLATVETGAQLEMDRAAYRLRRAAKKPYTAFGYSSPMYYIPRQSGFPKWFVVEAVSGTTRHALLFTRQHSGAPWLLAADPFPAEPLRGVKLDKDGYATAVAPGDARLAPGKVAEAHAAVLSRGAPGLAPGPYTTAARDALVKVQSGLRRHGVTLVSGFAPDTQPSFGLRTADGGALVWYVLRQNEEYTVPKAGIIGDGGDLTGLLNRPVRHHLSTTALIQYLASVPAQGEPRVIGVFRKAVRADAS